MGLRGGGERLTEGRPGMSSLPSAGGVEGGCMWLVVWEETRSRRDLRRKLRGVDMGEGWEGWGRGGEGGQGGWRGRGGSGWVALIREGGDGCSRAWRCL